MRRMRHLKPREIQGCQLALDASIATSLYDATTGGSLVAADGAVARWEDQSGNALHLTQATSGNRPLRRVGGINTGAVEFDGSNDVLHASLNISGASGVTALVVAQRASTASGVKIGFGNVSGFSTMGVTYGSGVSTNVAAMWGRRLTSDTRTDKNDVAETTARVYCGATDYSVFNATKNARAYGTDVWSGTAGTSGATDTILCGASTTIGGNPMDVSFGLAALWTRHIGAYAMSRMAGASMRKWRISG